ncbi:MAG: Ig-like domain-containing protein, partial [Myxococcaceae bacterium]
MTSVRCPALLLAASSLVLSACLDLGLPNVPPDGGVGPELTIQSPREGDTIALNAPVSVDAASINGVSSVTVTCGGAPSTGVFTWSVAPYTGVVDFTRCTLVTAGVNDAGIGQLKLTFIGVDFQGHQSSKSVNVFLDTTTASLSAVLPERVVPLAPLTLTVGSDRPLLLPPTVRLAGLEANGIVQRSNLDGGSPLYDVTFLKAPGIGIDNYGGDPYSVPFEVLSDVERSISLTVDARATNGNASHLEQGV